MRHRIKRILTLNINLLHSDKSTYDSNTYFYKDKLLSVGSNKGIKHTYSGLWFQTIPLSLFAFVFLLVLGLIMYPLGINIGSENVYAEAVTTDQAGYASISFSLSNGAGEEINQDDVVSTEATAGLVSYISNRINITTKNIERFYVTVQAASDGTSSLVGTEHKATIAPVSNDTVASSFSDNTWGYAVSITNTADSSLKYNPLPEYNENTAPQYTSSDDLVDGDHNLKLVFAAKINANKPADHYTTKAMVSVVADAKAITLSDITYMQEMTPIICSNSVENEAKQLVDGRDDKSYWVTKLADTCWMTQDLDLDLGPNGPVLTTDNTDYKGSATAWDGGRGVASSNSGWTTDRGNPIQNINWWERDTTHGTAHTSLGNLYSYEAATAGTGHTVTTSGGEVPGSICPAGWKLPLGGNNTATGSFSSLGLTSDNVMGDPYYFQMGGYVYGSLDLVGGEGNYWSATSYNSIDAHKLFFSSNGVNSMDKNARFIGDSVRCVVR